MDLPLEGGVASWGLAWVTETGRGPGWVDPSEGEGQGGDSEWPTLPEHPPEP